MEDELTSKKKLKRTELKGPGAKANSRETGLHEVVNDIDDFANSFFAGQEIFFS
jgi:hypothetical protein